MNGTRSSIAAMALGLACTFVSLGPRAGPVYAQEQAQPGISTAEFESLWRDLHVRKQPWATIPWRASVTKARALAAETHRPIFMVVNTGNCLGFV